MSESSIWTDRSFRALENSLNWFSSGPLESKNFWMEFGSRITEFGIWLLPVAQVKLFDIQLQNFNLLPNHKNLIPVQNGPENQIMKLKVGTRLMAVREDRRLSQEEMAELLGISKSAYSRVERNETMLTFDEISRFSQVLNIPVQELLPEIFTVHNNPSDQANGIVFGSQVINQINNYYYYSSDQAVKDSNARIQQLESELAKYKDG